VTVVVVTDSTAYLPAELTARHRIAVVPLRVFVGSRQGRDVEDVGPAEVAEALADPALPVGTSRPAPAEFAQRYRELLDGGADSVVSVHLSRRLSGTWEAARSAAAEVGGQCGDGRVRVVDSRSTGMGLGFAVLAAARAAEAGCPPAGVEHAAAEVAARTRVLFCVDSLEHLHRGGRIGAAAAWLGGALAVKPLLHVSDGLIQPLEKVRTAARAASRMVELAGRAAGTGPAELAVHHLGAAELAARLARRLPAARPCVVSEVGAAIGVHAGPGLLGVVIVPAPDDPPG
jgi:DegV family protein with EDD domain